MEKEIFNLKAIDLKALEKELSDNLIKRKELEGKLFAYIDIKHLAIGYLAIKRLYTVKNDKAYEVVEGDVLKLLEDDLWSIKRDCTMIGEYDPSKKNKLKTKKFSYSELIKALSL